MRLVRWGIWILAVLVATYATFAAMYVAAGVFALVTG